jgi:hypothetical protein
MKKNKSSISKMHTHEEIGEYWDTHDLVEHWEDTKPAEFEVDIQSEVTYFAVEKQLSEKIKAFARLRGVSPDTLLNLWVQEKLQEQNV